MLGRQLRGGGPNGEIRTGAWHERRIYLTKDEFVLAVGNIRCKGFSYTLNEVKLWLGQGYPPNTGFGLLVAGRGRSLMDEIFHHVHMGAYLSIEYRRILRLLWGYGATVGSYPDNARLTRAGCDLGVLVQAGGLAAFRSAALLRKKNRWRRIPVELYRMLVGFLVVQVL